MTFSIVARDAATGDLGIAVQSKFLAVGAVVPWARADVGAIATQAFANVAYGLDGLAALGGGASAAAALARLITGDSLREERQVGIVDASGRSASHTGRSCVPWAGGRIGDGFAAQGNILAGAVVVDAMVDRFLAGGLPFPERLVSCLAAADAAGGDARGRQSASILVVRTGGGYGGGNDRFLDLRVDEHTDPIGELDRILGVSRLYLDRPTIDDLVPLDADLAAELRRRLTSLGVAPGDASRLLTSVRSGENLADAARPMTGTPRPLPDGWDDTWQQALLDWMSVENLEERAAAAGWIDPRVVEFLRSRGGRAAAE